MKSGIRGLAQLLSYYPSNGRAVFGTHLMAYIQQLVIELGPKSDDMELRTIIPPLLDYRDELHRISIENEIHDNIRERSYENLDRIATGRQNRVTALQTIFPPLHYGTITALSVAILCVFLIETDRPVILFLDNFQLRLIWALLVGTITAIYCIGIDLSYPFVGTYTVPADRLLDESDEIMREIKATFPDRQLLEIMNGMNGVVEEEEEEASLPPPSLSSPVMTSVAKQETLLSPPPPPPPVVTVEETLPSPSPSQGMTYTDTLQSPNGEKNGSSLSPSPDWSQMTVEEMNRRWIEGR
jgi:Protein of unknown function (DUF4239)